jgi:hypothetical protein
VRAAMDATSGATSVFREVDRISNSEVQIVSITGTNNVIAAATCKLITNSKVSFVPTLSDKTYAAAGGGQIENCILNGLVTSTKLVQGNNIFGRLIDNERVINNIITIGAEYKASTIINSQSTAGNVACVEGNTIIDTEATPTSNSIFYLSAAIQHFINRNSYFGARPYWIGGALGPGVVVASCRDNALYTAAGVLVDNSSYKPAANTPWSWPNNSRYIIPLGGQVWKSDPTDATIAGWVKITQPGDNKTHWLQMAVNTAVP